MGWEFSPQRRVLLENAGFVYEFGNTKYTPLFRESYQPVNQVLPTVAPPLLRTMSPAAASVPGVCTPHAFHPLPAPAGPAGAAVGFW